MMFNPYVSFSNEPVKTIKYTISYMIDQHYHENHITIPVDKPAVFNKACIIQLIENISKVKWTNDLDTCIDIKFNTYQMGLDCFSTIFLWKPVMCANFVKVFTPNAASEECICKFHIDLTCGPNNISVESITPKLSFNKCFYF